MNYPRHAFYSNGTHPISICPPPAIGESITSWINRISARNSYPKSWAYHALGLTTSEHWRTIRGGQDIHLTTEHLNNIQKATGNPPEHTQQMTITGAYNNSGLITPPPTNANYRSWAIRNPILVSRTRYCPECLTTDGVWKLEWRIEYITACPTHHHLLNHTCPGCGQPAASGRQAGNSLTPVFITQPATPTHCMNTLPAPIAQPGRRSAPCGYPLHDSPRTPASPEAVHTDTIIRSHLTNPSQQWWADFTAVTAALLANIPPGSVDRLDPGNTFTQHEKNAYDAYVTATAARYTAGGRRTNSTTITDPAPVAVTASLAARIIDGDDTILAAILATPKGPHKQKQTLYNRIRTNKPSNQLLTRLEHHAAQDRGVAARNGFSRAYRHAYPRDHLTGVNPDGIPQYLWYDIFDEHFGPLHARNPKMRYDTFRKTISVALYKLVTNTTWKTASRRFTDTEIVSNSIGRHLMDVYPGTDGDHILTTIRTVAAHPVTQTRTQNYQQIRAAADLLFAEPVKPGTARKLLPNNATLARRTHLAAYAWAYTTGSIPYLSPAWATITTATEESARERYRQWRDHNLPTITQTVRQWAATQLEANGFTSLPTASGQDRQQT